MSKQNQSAHRWQSVKKEALKIRLFDGLFRSSDNIPRNILVNDMNELLSIDEGDIFFQSRSDKNTHASDVKKTSFFLRWLDGDLVGVASEKL